MSELLINAGATSVAESDLGEKRGLRRLLSGKFVVGSVIVIAIVLFALIGPLLVQNPRAVSDIGMTAPSSQHLLGTTQTGQDVLAQLAYGARGSLLIGVLVAVMVTALTAVFGIFGAYAGGLLDETFSLISNVMLIIPGLPLMIVIGSYVPQRGILLVAAVLAFTGWAAGARVLRAQTLSIRGRDYVLAARVSGERAWRVIFVEILPNLLPVMSSGFVFAIVGAILGEAGLSFIGIGASDSITWGTMLANSQSGQALLLGGWWWFVPPGLLIAVFGCGFALINFSLDEVINPKLRSQRTSPVVKTEEITA
ncbi:peptide/nickel transport system permease protein [Curtobacterium sp. PhB130]|uniref:ABC transporter permease n=1 Tax=unclassified Curtobacterium TaxID=257496 RepID=UPI000F4BC2E0|nr:MULTISPECIES: ABC transporter permease [unclassified Curtobacterium]ROS71855.1 peptide/nickel transport system permease protein [Curtobacterium sp. PhB130]TCK58249.1 peptide/nickel transport system permease protein [Curtobacterium sp. PhB136]